MGDPNMETALRWANELGPSPTLPSSLQDVTERSKLVYAINTSNLANSLFADFHRNLSIVEKAKCQNAIARLSRAYMSDVTDDKVLVNISLRLWSGCLSAAKTIAFQTMDGPNTPEKRELIFTQIEFNAQEDPIYRAGVEAAPTFKRLLKEGYSFEGVSKNSVVRRYP
ncbi:MAG: hypothetical protein A4E35_00611 [Methanoregula sp. PtaU1.Bin051]|nr:MAG: hypothetical protein A4E35_00611 [Methanoregula sp. PtaU1.Bin051]